MYQRKDCQNFKPELHGRFDTLDQEVMRTSSGFQESKNLNA